MKKIAMVSAATAASLAFGVATASADTTPVQSLKVKLTSSKAGTKSKPTAVGITVDTATTNQTDSPTTSKFTIASAKITLPKGIKLNYKAFPACAEADFGNCADAAPKSQVGSGTAKASVIGVDYSPTGTLTPFIGANSQLVIQTHFEKPAAIDAPLIAKVATASGGYSFAFTVPDILQTPLPPSGDQQIEDFNLKFDKKTVKKGKKKIGLVELTSCPKSGKYVFKGDFTYKGGQTATAETTVKCKAAKK